MSVRERFRTALLGVPWVLGRLGVLDAEIGREAFALALPVMVTGAFRVLLRFSDFLFVGLALGDAAIAGLELGFQYYFFGFGLSLALTSGTISVVSRLQGAGESERANLAVKQSLWLSIAVSLPLTAITWIYATPLLRLLTNDPTTVAYGAAYLRIVMLSLVFRFWSMVASRALAGSADTRTPMYVRLITLPTNVVLDAVLIFGLGPFPRLGVAGAAVGTAVANVLAGAVFFALVVRGDYAVTLRLRGPQFDASLLREIVRVAIPLAGMRLAQTIGRFPFLFILGIFGAPAIAAYAVSRRVMLFAMMPAWGYATAASTLVGQNLGAGDEEDAADYGWQTMRLGLATQLVFAAVIFAFAEPVSRAFGTAHVQLTVAFVRVFGLIVAGFSVSRTMRGSLRGAGDTRWPLYSTVVGTYLVQLPIAVLALPTSAAVAIPFGPTVSPGLGLGYPAVFASLIVSYYVRAAVNTGRFATGRWRDVARASGVGHANDD